MTPEEIKKQEEAFAELKKVVESGFADSKEGKEKIVKINEVLDTYEAKNQDLTTQILEEKNGRIDLEEKFRLLEKELARMPNGSKKEEKSMELKTFEKFITDGKGSIGPEEAKYLRTDVGPDGGFLVPSETENFIVKNITEVSQMRQIARVRTTSSKSLLVPTRPTLVSGGWVGEGGTATNDESTYGEIEIFARKLMVYSIVTNEMLQDAAFNMESEVLSDVGEDFGQLEGLAFVSGSGANQPDGFINNADIAITNTGVADNITADSIIDITGELKVGYNPSYVLNRKTLADVRQLKDGNGQYLWASGLAAGQPNTLNGHPYVSMIDMPDIAAAAKPIAFGDFNRGYTIIDRVGMSVIRDEFTLATSGKVRFVFMKRVGGSVVLPEAIKILQCAV